MINTQRMMCANQESAAAAWTFLEDRPPVIVDWLPWNHTFGGNHNFNMMLRNGGTLYIDEGKPVPALIGSTIANLREVRRPSISTCRVVMRRCSTIWRRTRRCSRISSPISICCSSCGRSAAEPVGQAGAAGSKLRGRKVPFISSWGLTETAPAVTMVHYAMYRPGISACRGRA